MSEPGVSVFSPPGDELAVLELPRPQLAALFAFRHWILDTARGITDTPAIVTGVGERFLGCGLHLDRMMTGVEFDAIARCDTPIEVDYLRHGGILHMVIREMAATT